MLSAQTTPVDLDESEQLSIREGQLQSQNQMQRLRDEYVDPCAQPLGLILKTIPFQSFTLASISPGTNPRSFVIE